MKKLIAIILALFSGSTVAAKDVGWIVGVHEYEGYPLFTRHPESLDFDVLQEKYPTQLVVSLSLEKIKENGLPQSDYNSSLEEFDIFVVEYFDEKSNGLCVLVETYYGKRHFYLYASESTDIKTFQKEIATKFSQHKIEYEIKPDAGWSFIRRYTKEILSNG